MFIKRLLINDFRNLEYVELEPVNGFNFICGRNGAGKTSIIEAIHYLAMARSFRTSNYQYLIRQSRPKFNLFALVQDDASSFDTSIGVSRARGEQAVLKINSDSAKMMDLIDHLCVQIIHPQGVELITNEAEGRRNFIDWGVYYTDPEFKGLWVQYRKILKQRNTLLKKEMLKRKGQKMASLNSMGYQEGQTLFNGSMGNAIPSMSNSMAEPFIEGQELSVPSSMTGESIFEEQSNGSDLSAVQGSYLQADLNRLNQEQSLPPTSLWDGSLNNSSALTSGTDSASLSPSLGAQGNQGAALGSVASIGAGQGAGSEPGQMAFDEVTVWDDALASLSEKITEKRLNYLSQLQVILQEIVGQFLPNYKIKFELNFGWEKGLNLRSVLAQNLEKDKGLGYTFYGCHRADLKIKNNTISAGATLSRGQLKMLVYALRLAQGMLLKEQSNRACIYLIDDLNSELDDNSQRVLLDTLLQCQHQVFISNIEQELLFPKDRSDFKVFNLDKGMVSVHQSSQETCALKKRGQNV